MQNTLTDIHLTSIKKKEYWTFYVLGIITFLSLAIFCFTKYTPENHSRNFCLILSIIFLIIAFICFYNLISIKTFCIAKNKLIVMVFGKVTKSYNLDEVESWTEKQRKDKYEQWETLTLHFKTGEKEKISSSIYDNYFELKNELTKNKIRNRRIEKLIEKKFGLKVAIFCLAIGALFLFWSYKALQVKNIKPQDIVVFGDKTSENIQYFNYKSSYVLIKLENSPDLDFRIDGTNIAYTIAQDLINDIKPGDSIFIGIDKSEYGRKITKEDSLSFADKYFFNHNITVTSLKSAKKDYLTLSDVNTIQSNSKYWNFGLSGFFGLIMTLGGIYGIQKIIAERQDE